MHNYTFRSSSLLNTTVNSGHIDKLRSAFKVKIMDKEVQHKFTFKDFKTTIAAHSKAVIIYCISIVALTAATVYFFNYGLVTSPLLGIICQTIIFLAIGIFHTWWLHKELEKIVFPGSLLFSTSLSLIVFASQLLLFKNANVPASTAFAFSCAFLLPYSIYQSWLWFVDIPEKEYKLWYVPETLIDHRVMVYLNSIPVQLKLSKHYFDSHDQTFQIIAPGQASFGRVFNQFVIEHNNDRKFTVKIENSDTHRTHYGWVFFLEGFNGLFNKRIDPEVSMLDNGIKENAVIIAERVYITKQIKMADNVVKVSSKKTKK